MRSQEENQLYVLARLDKIKAYGREYYYKNKEKYKVKKQEYYQNNKDKYHEYYEKNIDKYKKRYKNNKKDIVSLNIEISEGKYIIEL